jgi:hypothetical protein
LVRRTVFGLEGEELGGATVLEFAERFLGGVFLGHDGGGESESGEGNEEAVHGGREGSPR